jgi:uncharacterized protein YcfJ
MKKVIAIVVLACFASVCLVGCATTGGDAQRTKTEGTVAGGGVGAAVGGLLGYVIGGKSGAAIGAAIGAGIGAAVGYAYGSHVAQEKKKYANEEDWLNACVASAEKVNHETSAYCTQLGGEIADLEVKTSELQAQYEQKSVEKSALDQEQKAIEAKRAETEEKLKKARFELENQEKVLADARANKKAEFSSKLDSEIEALKKNIADLETHSNTLASMSQRMAV